MFSVLANTSESYLGKNGVGLRCIVACDVGVNFKIALTPNGGSLYLAERNSGVDFSGPFKRQVLDFLLASDELQTLYEYEGGIGSIKDAFANAVLRRQKALREAAEAANN